MSPFCQLLLQFEDAIATKTNREKLSEGCYVYDRHSRKINLWREFKREGVTVKRVKKDIKVELRLA
jgi:hypothetical protein